MTKDDRLEAVLTATSADLLLYFERRVGGEAPDLLAETMVTAWRRAEALPSADVGARMWLFGIARHVLHNASRGERRRSRLADRLRALRTSREHAVPADDGLEVRDAIDRLDPESGELIRLVYWDGFTVVQVAELLGLPASTVRSRHQRAKQQLRRILEVEPRELSRGARP